MMRRIVLKKTLGAFIVSLIILVSLFYFFLYLLNMGYEEQRYEIDYSLLSELIDYYDNVGSNVLHLISYQCCRERIVNSFFSKENSRSKENYALIYSLKNIRSYYDVKRFIRKSEVQILRSQLILFSYDGYNYDDAQFFICVRRYNFWKHDEVLLLVSCNGINSEPSLIIR